MLEAACMEPRTPVLGQPVWCHFLVPLHWICNAEVVISFKSFKYTKSNYHWPWVTVKQNVSSHIIFTVL